MWLTTERLRYAPDLTDGLTSHARVAALVGSNKHVLDVGCGGGFLAERLALRGCVVTGVDNDPALLQRAQTVCQNVIRHDLDALDGLDFQEKFDVVVMADVIEHLLNAKALLAKAASWLQPSGFVVISVPNIAHISVRLKLLVGRFDYSQNGILDETHVHFFTSSSISSLLTQAEYETSDIVPVGRFPVLARFEHHLWLRRLEAAAASVWPGLCAFQFVLKATPR